MKIVRHSLDFLEQQWNELVQSPTIVFVLVVGMVVMAFFTLAIFHAARTSINKNSK